MPAPTLTAPADALIDVSLLPSFSWEAVVGASVYQIQVGLLPDFEEPLLDVEIASSPLALSTLVGEIGYPLDFGFPYYWRVRAKVTGAWDAWSTSRSFRVQADVLAYTPNLDHPGEAQDLLLEQFKERG